MNNAAGKEKYERMWQTTAEVIRAWDPYNLLAGGSPSDEFDSEISSVVTYISRMRSPSDAASAVSQVFSSNFEPHLFTPKDCSEVGARLFARLKEQGFVP
jgi:hypothetical protein